MVEPVTASLFVVLLLGDHLSRIQLLGMLIILLTVTVLSRKQIK
jgi:drug/metabolite transporter, DME family